MSSLGSAFSAIEPRLDQRLLDVIENKFGFTTMTPVQESCIPPMLKYKDVIGEAVTGSGKTLAFLVPVLQIILRREYPIKKHEVYGLVLAPTRELAVQIFDVLQTFKDDLPEITSLLLCGGCSIQEEINAFQNDGGNIIIGTPGRIVDVFNRSVRNPINLATSCKALEILILDEADRLLERGFSEKISTIFAYCPKQRRTSLFSATQTSDVRNLIRAGLRNPMLVRVKQPQLEAKQMSKTPTSLNNYYMICKQEDKFSILVSLLQERKSLKTLVFFASCAAVDYFAELLTRIVPECGIHAIHGKQKGKRKVVLRRFRDAPSGALLCTDVMGRGIDLHELDWVLQFDTPSQPENFVHRCGRTARSGREGSALLLLLESERSYVNFLESNQYVALREMEAPDTVPSLLDRMREVQRKDLAIVEKGRMAYVSFIQFYKKHACGMLFKLEKLNLGLLGMCYGLLDLPKMPEMKKFSTDDFVPADFDKNSITYKNKEREISRQKKLEIYNETGKWPTSKKDGDKPKQTVAWSKNKEIKAKKKLRKQKKEEALKRKLTAEDVEEASEDYHQMQGLKKKLKKQKISTEDFDKEFLTQKAPVMQDKPGGATE